MKLLLTSSGITNPSIEKALLKLLGKSYGESHLTFIPTAANVEEGDKTWLVDDIYRFRKLGFASFDIIDIAAVGQDIWLPSLEKADILVFGGGNVKYLIESMGKSGVARKLSLLLEKKVYVGISAGSMVTAREVTLSSAGILYYEETGNFENIEGLGFVDFEIRPHLNSKWFPKVRDDVLTELAPKVPSAFYAIDDDTAIQVVDGDIKVVSEGLWKKFND